MNENDYDLTIPDDALTELSEMFPGLKDLERKFIYWRSIGIPPLGAYKNAGYKGSSWRQIETRPKIRDALMELNERLEPEYRVTQKKVIGILMEAVEIARRKDQPKVLVEAATALANISGVAAAAKIQIDQSMKLAVEHREIKAIEHLPKDGLERMIGINRTLPSQEIIDGEYAEVKAIPQESDVSH